MIVATFLALCVGLVVVVVLLLLLRRRRLASFIDPSRFRGGL